MEPQHLKPKEELRTWGHSSLNTGRQAKGYAACLKTHNAISSSHDNSVWYSRQDMEEAKVWVESMLDSLVSTSLRLLIVYQYLLLTMKEKRHTIHTDLMRTVGIS